MYANPAPTLNRATRSLERPSAVGACGAPAATTGLPSALATAGVGGTETTTDEMADGVAVALGHPVGTAGGELATGGQVGDA
jgi:hypothetical protein